MLGSPWFWLRTKATNTTGNEKGGIFYIFIFLQTGQLSGGKLALYGQTKCNFVAIGQCMFWWCSVSPSHCIITMCSNSPLPEQCSFRWDPWTQCNFFPKSCECASPGSWAEMKEQRQKYLLLFKYYLSKKHGGCYKEDNRSGKVQVHVSKSLRTVWTRYGKYSMSFVLRKKGSKAKKRMKEEEIVIGDCGPPTWNVFFEIFLDLNQVVPNHLTEYGPVVYPANAFDSRLRGDQVPLGSSPTKSQKRSIQWLDAYTKSWNSPLPACVRAPVWKCWHIVHWNYPNHIHESHCAIYFTYDWLLLLSRMSLHFPRDYTDHLISKWTIKFGVLAAGCGEKGWW